jgi:hypothetical protein
MTEPKPGEGVEIIAYECWYEDASRQPPVLKLPYDEEGVPDVPQVGVGTFPFDAVHALVRLSELEAMRERAERAERTHSRFLETVDRVLEVVGLNPSDHTKPSGRKPSDILLDYVTALQKRATDAESKLAEVERERDEFREECSRLDHMFSCVIDHATGGRASKTNYTREVYYQLIEEETMRAVDEAVEEATEELESQVAELRKALEGVVQHFGLWPEVIPRPTPPERDAPRAAINAAVAALASTASTQRDERVDETRSFPNEAAGAV